MYIGGTTIMHAERCPVCYGSGKVMPPDNGGTAVPQPITCHGCAGKGWVEVGDTFVPYIPIYPYPQTYPYRNITWFIP